MEGRGDQHPSRWKRSRQARARIEARHSRGTGRGVVGARRGAQGLAAGTVAPTAAESHLARAVCHHRAVTWGKEGRGSDNGPPRGHPTPHSPPAYWWHRSACRCLPLRCCCCCLRRPLPHRAGRWGAGAEWCWTHWGPVGPQPGHRGRGCLNCGWELGWPWDPGHLRALLAWRPRCCQGRCSGRRRRAGGQTGSWAAQLGIEGAGCCGRAWSHFWLETVGGGEEDQDPVGWQVRQASRTQPSPKLGSTVLAGPAAPSCPLL